MARKMKTMDGNHAAAHAYATRWAAIYPITPSSPMAEGATDEWAPDGKNHYFRHTVQDYRDAV